MKKESVRKTLTTIKLKEMLYRTEDKETAEKIKFFIDFEIGLTMNEMIEVINDRSNIRFYDLQEEYFKSKLDKDEIMFCDSYLVLGDSKLALETLSISSQKAQKIMSNKVVKDYIILKSKYNQSNLIASPTEVKLKLTEILRGAKSEKIVLEAIRTLNKMNEEEAVRSQNERKLQVLESKQNKKEPLLVSPIDLSKLNAKELREKIQEIEILKKENEKMNNEGEDELY